MKIKRYWYVKAIGSGEVGGFVMKSTSRDGARKKFRYRYPEHFHRKLLITETGSPSNG